MSEREDEYRGCRLHRYLMAEATPAERQALREATQRVNIEGATQIVLLFCYEVDAISRLGAVKPRGAAEKQRARGIWQLIQTVCCQLSAACLFVTWGVAGSVKYGTRPMCWATTLHMTGWTAAFGIFAWVGGLMDQQTSEGPGPNPVRAGAAPSETRRLQLQMKGVLAQ